MMTVAEDLPTIGQSTPGVPAMRAIMRNGPVWPTKAVLRIALPLTRPEDTA